MERFMTEELKGLLKTLAIRMVDAMDLWGNQDNPKGAKPSWREKEHAMTEYLGSREGVETLLNVVAADISKLPEGTENVGLVTVKFIVATCRLLEAYMEIEFPKEEPVAPEATAAPEEVAAEEEHHE